MNAALRASLVTVNLGGRDVVRGVSLDVPAGQWTSIVGPNGAGKTTLLKALAHLLPYAGTVSHADADAAALTAQARARRIAWLGQNEEGAHDLLAHDVVMLGRLPHQAWFGSPSREDRAAVEEAMRETQCWDWRARPLGQLSGGERQRVLLARALAVRAPLLLMDEPLANLDPPHQSDWLASVRRHVAKGGTAISVLHELTMALHAQRVVVMDEGRVVHHGPSADPATHRALEAVFRSRIAVRELEGQWVALPLEKPG